MNSFRSKFTVLTGTLNTLWADLKNMNIKEMPRLVFDDLDDWLAVTEILPPEILPDGRRYMLSGFKFEYARQPINECDRFVAQEIGA